MDKLIELLHRRMDKFIFMIQETAMTTILELYENINWKLKQTFQYLA
jgi:hypothetical protein